MFKTGIAVAVAALGAARTIQAQVLREVSRPPFEVGIGVAIAQPTGDFGNYVSLGGGLIGHGVWSPDRFGVFGLRLDMSGIIYGSTTRTYTLVPLIDVDVTTNNAIATVLFGPQLAAGDAVRLYGFGELGFSYFATTSSVEGSGNIGPFAHTTNFDDLTFATAAGGGMKIQLTHSRHPLSLDVGARYVYNGRARYLRSSSIVITGNTVQYTPIESETNLILYQVGVSVGLGGR